MHPATIKARGKTLSHQTSFDIEVISIVQIFPGNIGSRTIDIAIWIAQQRAKRGQYWNLPISDRVQGHISLLLTRL